MRSPLKIFRFALLVSCAVSASGAFAQAPSNEELYKLVMGLKAEQEKLREENAVLRDVSENLRKAAEADGIDATMINRAMQAELDALRALRAAEAAEVATILAELKPLIEEAK